MRLWKVWVILSKHSLLNPASAWHFICGAVTNIYLVFSSLCTQNQIQNPEGPDVEKEGKTWIKIWILRYIKSYHSARLSTRKYREERSIILNYNKDYFMDWSPYIYQVPYDVGNLIDGGSMRYPSYCVWMLYGFWIVKPELVLLHYT